MQIEDLAKHRARRQAVLRGMNAPEHSAADAPVKSFRLDVWAKSNESTVNIFAGRNMAADSPGVRVAIPLAVDLPDALAALRAVIASIEAGILECSVPDDAEWRPW